MLVGEFKNIEIKGISVAVPSELVSVSSFNEMFGEENVQKFSELTGVKTVCRAVPDQTASDLGYEAAINLFDRTEIDKTEIEILIFVTQKPDFRVPSTAFSLQERLGLGKNCICFDLNLACSGFIYGLQTIFAMLQSSSAKSALLITADTSIRTLSPHDRTMVMLFGDSGSATLVCKADKNSIARFGSRSDGSRFKSIITPSGAYRNRFAPKERVPWSDEILRSDYDTHMKGMDVFGFSIMDVPLLVKDFLEHFQVNVDAYDVFALHQANLYILKQISRKLKIPFTKIPVVLDRYGNNSSNSIPLLLADQYGGKDGETIRVLMSGFGAGLSWACADLELDTTCLYPLVVTDNFLKN